ncbi:MAG: glycosyltransferase family 2 protein [Acidiphilium sp.]|nr:glycosyltransferase family 2 protein [Acidiphilium sp.]MDD4936967.1 glycosyltransferase family 2 protein [Acidiphilium sp.]
MMSGAGVGIAGYIDFYGFHSGAGGWFLCGWATQDWKRRNSSRLSLGFEEGDQQGFCDAAYFDREDVRGKGDGILIFLQSEPCNLGSLMSITALTEDDPGLMLLASNPAHHLRDQELTTCVRSYIDRLPHSPERMRLSGLMSRRGYQGLDTLGSIASQVRFEIDQSILCSPNGIILCGWCVAQPGAIRTIRLRSGVLSSVIDLATAIRTERRDVAETIGAEMGVTGQDCGFTVFLPNAIQFDEGETYIEIETQSGKTAYRRVEPARMDPMQALHRMLGEIDLQYAAVAPGFDNVVGPAVGALNVARLAHRSCTSVLDFGDVPTTPRVSVIVTLYGRLDFMEVQIALASAYTGNDDVELIYVLDNPSQRREAEGLAESVFARFGVPFRLIALATNLGYGPANNVGLQHARGSYICFVNSDVFPGTPNWIERLAEHLEADPQLGVVGPLLLFEDGSVQHAGISFQPIARFSDWQFPIHDRKGWRPCVETGLGERVAITGACLMMRAADARSIGGFDEDYVIGDFEDVDLCLRMADAGFKVAIDTAVWLYHLERQSQVSPDQRWRMNLTLYNAWLFQRRWGAHPAVMAH